MYLTLGYREWECSQWNQERTCFFLSRPSCSSRYSHPSYVEPGEGKAWPCSADKWITPYKGRLSGVWKGGDVTILTSGNFVLQGLLGSVWRHLWFQRLGVLISVSMLMAFRAFLWNACSVFCSFFTVILSFQMDSARDSAKPLTIHRTVPPQQRIL